MGKYIYDALLVPEEEGGYSISVPALPGCFSCGDDFDDAVYMAADAMKTYVAALLSDGEFVAPSSVGYQATGDEKVVSIFFETDESYIVSGEVVSAAQAARELGVSAGRVSHMINAGLLEGYRDGRRTMVTVESIEKRKADPRSAGRPRKAAMA